VDCHERASYAPTLPVERGVSSGTRPARASHTSAFGCFSTLRSRDLVIRWTERIAQEPRTESNRSSSVSSRVVDFTTFTCVHCLDELEMPLSSWDGWVRCRACERVFLPPKYESARRTNSKSAVSNPDTGLLHGDSSPNGNLDLTDQQPPSDRMSHTTPARLVFTTGFVLCLLLTLIKFLDFSPGGMAIFGFLTIAFFLLLIRTPRRRLPPAGATWVRQVAPISAQDDSGLSANS
jgi:hypothetical protein